MMWVALLTVAVYLTLKSGQLAFLGEAGGYRDEPMSIGRRLCKGEPILLLVATMITVPPALVAIWYHHHKFEAVLANAVKCYGLILAYRQTPEIMRSNGEHAVYESVYGYRSTAFGASRQLGLDAKVVERQLFRAGSALTTESRRAGGVARQDRLSATQSCLHPPEEPPNA